MSTKLAAYKSIIELAELLRDVVKSPDAISEAGKQYASAFSMSDIEKAKREDALAIISKAESSQKEMSDFRSEVESEKKYLAVKKTELAELQRVLDSKKLENEKVLQEANDIRDKAKLSMDDVNKKMNYVSIKERELEEKNSIFENNKYVFEKEKIQHQEKVKFVIERENAIAEFSGKIARK